MQRLARHLTFALLLCLGACSGEEGGGEIGLDGPKTTVQACDLLITEIMSKPSSPVSGRRWVEIFNASGETIDLSRVRLRVTKPDTKPATADLRGVGGALLLPPGEFLWVRIDAQPLPDEMVADYNVFETTKSIAIPEDEFEIALETLTGTIIHAVSFGPKDAPCTPDSGLVTPPALATDQAMELRAAFFSCAASVQCGAWVGASDEAIPGDKGFGTPGKGPTPTNVIAGASPLPGEVAISEIMYRSGGDVGEADWVELVNLSDEWLSLQGCVIGDGTASGDHTIGDSLILCPGQMAVLSSKSLEEIAVEVDYVFGGKPNLNQSGDRFYLRCPGEDGTLQDIIDLDFSSGAGLFPVPSGNASVQVCPDKLPAEPTAADYHNPAAWAVTPDDYTIGTSLDLGTPGQVNPTCGGEPPQPCEPPCTGNATCTMLNGEPVCAVTPGPGDAMLTEFMVNGSEACSAKKDWVEIYNLTGNTLVLTGCTLADDTGSLYALSGAVAIPAHGYLVLVQDAAGCTFDAPNTYCYGTNPNLNAGGDSFTLACNGQVVFTFEYGATGQPPPPSGGDSGNRVSVQLSSAPGTPPSPAAAADAANWCSSKTATACGDLATPGMVNHLCGDGPVGTCDPPCGDGYTCAQYNGQPVCARAPLPFEVIPTEIMANGSDACSGGKDWFELLNLATQHIELKGCLLSDDNSSTYPVADSVVIGPGDYIAFVQSASGCTFDAPRFYCYGGSPNLNTGDDSLSLSCGGQTIFDVAYGSEGEIPAPGKVDGAPASVQAGSGGGAMDPEQLLNPTNWKVSCTSMACGDYGTPGKPNPVCN